MNILTFALMMLKKQWKESIGYVLVLMLSILVSFIFTDLIDNQLLIDGDLAAGYGTWQSVKVPLSKGLPFIIIFVCWIMILYASQYYFNKKTKEFALLAISGSSSFDISKYSLYQVILILCIDTPIAFLIGTCLLPVIYFYMYRYLNINYIFYQVPISTYLNTLASLIPIVMVIFLSITGFIRAHSIQELTGRSQDIKEVKNKEKRLKNSVYLLIYIIGIMLMIFQKHSLVIYIAPTVIGISSMIGIINQGIPSFIKNWNNRKGIEKKYSFIALSNYSVSLRGCTYLIMCMVLLIAVLLPILISQKPYTNEYITNIMSYIVMIILLVIGIVYKFCTHILMRKKEFECLSRIGYTRIELLKIIKKEIYVLYATIILLPLPYILVIGTRFMIYEDLSIQLFIFLLGIYMIPVIISSFVTYHLYKKIMMISRKGENNHE